MSTGEPEWRKEPPRQRLAWRAIVVYRLVEITMELLLLLLLLLFLIKRLKIIILSLGGGGKNRGDDDEDEGEKNKKRGKRIAEGSRRNGGKIFNLL